MSETLYLIETRAKSDYLCSACQRRIPRGAFYFRHDPFPAARMFRGQMTTHWCKQCIMASNPGPKEYPTQRVRVPAIRVLHQVPPRLPTQLSLLEPLRVELIGIGRVLSEQLRKEPELINRIGPEQFEEFVSDRLYSMGFEPKRVGETNRKDGGVDVLFWPRFHGAFPFLGAAQVKHHYNPSVKDGPATVREFAGTFASFPFNAGLLITNTSFTPDARWFAHEHAKLLRLRDIDDIRRWLFDNFDDDAEWREIPASIELCPGVIIRIR